MKYLIPCLLMLSACQTAPAQPCTSLNCMLQQERNEQFKACLTHINLQERRCQPCTIAPYGMNKVEYCKRLTKA